MKTPIFVSELSIPGYTEPEKIVPKIFPYHTFAYVIKGEILAELNGKNHLIGPGQLIVIPENQAITIKHFDGCWGFGGHFLMDGLKDASYPVLHGDHLIQQSFWFDDAVFMGALFKRMVSACEDRDNTFLQSAMDLVLSQIRPSGKVAVIPEQFLQLVFDKKSIPLGVSDYAGMLNVTPNYLNKTVKHHTHRTAIDWIEIARLNLAKQLLKDRSVPISDVAERTGIPDQSYFSRFFKKKTGLTPSQFRNGR